MTTISMSSTMMKASNQMSVIDVDALEDELTGGKSFAELDREALMDVATPETDGSIEGRQAFLEAFHAAVDEQVKAKSVERSFAEEMEALVSRFHDTEVAKDELSWEQADLMKTFDDAEGWKAVGAKSFSQWARSPLCPINKSTAYRYRAVGQFMDKIGDFDPDFYREWGINITPVYDEDGQLDEQATREANSIRRMAAHTDVARIAQGLGGGKYNLATAKELLANAIMLDAQGFDQKMKQYTGTTNEVAEALADRNMNGYVAMVPLYDKDIARRVMNDLQAMLDEEGDMLADMQQDENAAPVLGSKSVKFRDYRDRVVIGYI